MDSLPAFGKRNKRLLLHGEQVSAASHRGAGGQAICLPFPQAEGPPEQPCQRQEQALKSECEVSVYYSERHAQCHLYCNKN